MQVRVNSDFSYDERRTFSIFYSSNTLARMTCPESTYNLSLITITIILNDEYKLHYEQCHLLLPILMRCIMYGHIDVLNNVIKVCRRRYSQENNGFVLLCKCVPVLTLDVLHIAEDPHYDGRLTTLAKSGYFSAVLFIQKSTDPASCFCASRSVSCNWIHTIHSPPL